MHKPSKPYTRAIFQKFDSLLYKELGILESSIIGGAVEYLFSDQASLLFYDAEEDNFLYQFIAEVQGEESCREIYSDPVNEEYLAVYKGSVMGTRFLIWSKFPESSSRGDRIRFAMAILPNE